MAVSYRVGRPYHVADINFAEDHDQELYDRFYEACRALSYSEMVALARALQVTLRCMRYWREGKCFPSTRGTAMHVIAWVANGKPIKRVTQAEAAEGMFSG